MLFTLQLSLHSYLNGDVQLGRLLGGSRSFVNGPIQIHGHGEDWGVNRARLGQQAILQPWSDLVQPHQSIHWLVGVYGFTVQDWHKEQKGRKVWSHSENRVQIRVDVMQLCKGVYQLPSQSWTDLPIGEMLCVINHIF